MSPKKQIHIKMFTILHMVASLGPSLPLYQIGINTLQSTMPPKFSWFMDLAALTQAHDLPTPLLVLLSPYKLQLKKQNKYGL